MLVTFLVDYYSPYLYLVWLATSVFRRHPTFAMLSVAFLYTIHTIANEQGTFDPTIHTKTPHLIFLHLETLKQLITPTATSPPASAATPPPRSQTARSPPIPTPRPFGSRTTPSSTSGGTRGPSSWWWTWPSRCSRGRKRMMCKRNVAMTRRMRTGTMRGGSCTCWRRRRGGGRGCIYGGDGLVLLMRKRNI